MTIANPIYDIIFKYLMEDSDIAKGLLSAILEVEIVELSVQPQETVSETAQEADKIRTFSFARIFRIDFAAVIKQPDGTVKKVLIELQKTKITSNVVRFRRYLAENYQKEDVMIIDGKEKKRPLEIITIYLLGFNLDKVSAAILHAKPSFRDVVNNTPADYASANEFIRLLTHESYFIQIPKLVEPTKTRIEKVLSIFNQTQKSNNDHSLIINKTDDDPLLQKMANRLTRAIADENMRRRMNVEDEIESDFAEFQEKLEAKVEEVRQREAVIDRKNQVIEQKEQVIEQNKQELEQNKQELEQNKRLIEELRQMLLNKEK